MESIFLTDLEQKGYFDARLNPSSLSKNLIRRKDLPRQIERY
jgi:hypothetical protein